MYIYQITNNPMAHWSELLAALRPSLVPDLAAYPLGRSRRGAHRENRKHRNMNHVSRRTRRRHRRAGKR